MSPRLKLALMAGAVLGADAMLIAFVDPNGRPPESEELRVGILVGSIFGQTTLAAAWAALGPGARVWRVAASLLWVLLVTLCVGVNLRANAGPDGGFVLMLGGCLLGQWTALQIPLWGLVVGYGLSLRHVGEEARQAGQRDRQFGIRELIILTGIVGVLLGIGRAAVHVLGKDLSFDRNVGDWVFLAAAAALLSLPLVLATLLRQYAGRGVLLVLLAIAVLTGLEWTLYRIITPFPLGGPRLGHLIAINAVMAAVLLAVCGVARWCGFRLCRTAR